jgi:hypothetical protein
MAARNSFFLLVAVRTTIDSGNQFLLTQSVINKLGDQVAQQQDQPVARRFKRRWVLEVICHHYGTEVAPKTVVVEDAFQSFHGRRKFFTTFLLKNNFRLARKKPANCSDAAETIFSLEQFPDRGIFAPKNTGMFF